jgi:hypothetical protein
MTPLLKLERKQIPHGTCKPKVFTSLINIVEIMLSFVHIVEGLKVKA